MSRVTHTLFVCLVVVAAAMPPVGSAAAEEPACLKCHEPVKARLKKKVVHAAVAIGCVACHTDHREAGAPKSPHYLNSQPPELCLTCHEAGDDRLVKTHRGQPFAKAACTGCHDPHSSDSPKLINGLEHGPFAARQCDGCHLAPQDGKVRLAAKIGDLCFRCHDDFRQRLEKSASRHSLLNLSADACVDCHTPHAGRTEHYLKQPVTALCNGCHEGVTADRKYVHEPVRTSCVACHDAHGAQQPKQLHAGVNALCLECHGADAARKFQTPEPVSLFDGHASLPPRPFERLVWLPLRAGAKLGHPFPNHPIQRPAENGKAEINCVVCHRPHAANGSPKLLVNETPATTQLCVKCH